MLVCSVSQRARGAAIAADMTEIAGAIDALGTGNVVFATLVDDPASVSETIDAFLGEVMLEAASADTVLDGSVPASYAVDITEAAAAASIQDGSAAIAMATWDTATVTAVTLSGGNLVATNTGTTSLDQGAHVAFASAKSTGKYYFEVTVTNYAGGGGVGFGIGNTSAVYSGISYLSTNGDMCFVKGHTNNGPIWAPTGNSGLFLGARSSGDVLGLAVDFNSQKIWFRVCPSGSWNGVVGHDPTLPDGSHGGFATPSGSSVPFVTFGSGIGGAAGVAGNVMTANFGAAAFTGAVPSGYTAGWPV